MGLQRVVCPECGKPGMLRDNVYRSQIIRCRMCGEIVDLDEARRLGRRSRRLGLYLRVAGAGFLALLAVLVIVLLSRTGGPAPRQSPDDGQVAASGLAQPQQASEPAPHNESVARAEVSAPQEKPAVEAKAPAPAANAPAQPAAAPPPAKEKPVLVLDPEGHSDLVRVVLFTRDGRQVISVSKDKTVRFWDVATGETVRSYHFPTGPGYEGALYAADLSPDGKKLAVGGIPVGNGRLGQFVYILDLESGRIEKTFTGHKDIIAHLQFSPSGQLLASASNDGTARLYELASGRTVHVYTGHGASIKSLAFSADSQLLATVSYDRTCRIWSVNTGRGVTRLAQLPSFVWAVAWSPDGQTLATGCADGTVQIWERGGQRLHTYTIERGASIWALAYNKDGRELLFTAGSKAGLLDPATGTTRLTFAGHDNLIVHGCFSPDCQRAVTTGGNDHQTYVWKTSDGSVVQTLTGKGRSVWALGWGGDGKTLAWGNTNKGSTLRATTPLENTFLLDSLELGAPAGDRDFGRATTAKHGYTLELVDPFHVAISSQGQRRHVFGTPFKGNAVRCMTVLPGDRAVIGATAGLYLVDLAHNKIVRELRGHSGFILAVAPAPDGRLFATGSTDQTIRIWSPDMDEPLLSLFVAGGSWIAWTPQGYYAASPFGEKLMGWQINRGTRALGQYFPASRFRKSLYQPELIRRVTQAGSVAQALAQARQEKKENIAEVANVAQVLPPQVVLTAPGPRGHFDVQQATLEVRARATRSGDQPVTSMRLLVDGRPHQGDKGIRTFPADEAREVEASWNVDLLPGKHALAVLAESAVSKALTPWVEVTRTGVGADELPRLYLLAVGISAYPGNMRLVCAHSDAISIVQTFRQRTRGVFRKVETRVLIDAEATRANILAGLTWLKQKMTAKDVGIISFSGHGTQDLLRRFYLVPVDVSERDPGGTCIAGDYIKRTLANMPGRLIAILDSCRSGAVATGPGLLARPNADDLVRDLVTEDYGVIVLSSSQGRENSAEIPATRHGLYTLCLLEALAGKADYNHDGYVYLHELERYTFMRVLLLSRGRQHPVSGRPPHLRPFPLTKIR